MCMTNGKIHEVTNDSNDIDEAVISELDYLDPTLLRIKKH